MMNNKCKIIKNSSEMPKHQEGMDIDYDDPRCLIEQYGFPTKDISYVVNVNGKPKTIFSKKALTEGLSLEEAYDVIDKYCNKYVDMLEDGTYNLSGE